MARVIIEDRTGARLDIELTKGRAEFGPNGNRVDEEWHVVAFADGRVYEPAPTLHPENAMLGEFARHDIAKDPVRPHVESGLCSCRPRFDAELNEWLHVNKQAAPEEAEAVAAGTPVMGPTGPQDGQGEAQGPDMGSMATGG